jgi:hypothetical protein
VKPKCNFRLSHKGRLSVRRFLKHPLPLFLAFPLPSPKLRTREKVTFGLENGACANLREHCDFLVVHE